MMMRLVSLQFDHECCSAPLLVQSTSSLQCRSKEPMSQMSNLQPIFSISLISAVCAGTMRAPKSLTVTSIAAWQQAFFQSEFTHPGGGGRLTKRHGGTSSLFNTFNNLTRLLGTAKYLIIRGSQDNNGGSNGGCEKVQRLGQA